MKDEMMRREIQEAITAGEVALGSLYNAQNYLNSARNWGIFDMLGGGFFTDIMKHSKMNDASRCMEEAKHYLQLFQKELKDVQVPMNFRMEVGGFLSFADFFFDGLVADYLVQSRIGEAREQVEDAIGMVSHLLEELKSMNRM